MSIEVDRGLVYNRLKRALAREIRLAATADAEMIASRLAVAVREAIYVAAAEEYPDRGVRFGVAMIERYIHDPEAI